MGMALRALAGDLIPERTREQAARLLTLRHVGIALTLLVLAPVVADRLTSATETARLRGVALLLDARLSPVQKLGLAPELLASVNSTRPRASLQAAIVAHRGGFGGADLAAYDQLARRADQTLVTAVNNSFQLAFIITGAMALLAAAVLAPRPLRRGLPIAAVAVLVVGAPASYALVRHALAPAPVPIRNPCLPRALPGTGGLAGAVQDQALALLDTTACRLHSSREELVLALTSDRDARAFQARHGVDPRSLTGILAGLLGQ
jgi:hypothetical protein